MLFISFHSSNRSSNSGIYWLRNNPKINYSETKRHYFNESKQTTTIQFVITFSNSEDITKHNNFLKLKLASNASMLCK